MHCYYSPLFGFGINKFHRSEPGRGIGIAVSSGSWSLTKAVKDATLVIDKELFVEVGGVRVHVYVEP